MRIGHRRQLAAGGGEQRFDDAADLLSVLQRARRMEGDLLRRRRGRAQQLDQPRPQIRLKAFIVQTDRSTAQQLGIQWGGLLKGSNFQMSPAQAGAFYAEHAERPFYGELVNFMASEPVVVQVLEGEGAIAKNREVMGATDPAAADAGTIRKEFALSKGENSVHGSDSAESAAREIAFFFSGLELVG